MSRRIPIAIATCCREWDVAVYHGGWGRCGLCGERPEFTRMLPEEEWLDEPDRKQG